LRPRTRLRQTPRSILDASRGRVLNRFYTPAM
jgi:hypothetical protein